MQTYKLLEDNVADNLGDSGFGNEFWHKHCGKFQDLGLSKEETRT